MRKEAVIVIDQPNRDMGRAYFIKEMPASQAEWWAWRAFLALARGGIDVPDYVRGMGIAGLALVGLKSLGHVQTEEARVLLDEMLACVWFVPDQKNQEHRIPLVEEHIEEVATRLALRDEVFKLHTGFSFADATLILASAPRPQTDSSNTETSPA